MDWSALERRIVTRWQDRQYSDALFELDQFLSSKPAEEMVQQALTFRAETQVRRGDLDAAKKDLRRAKKLAAPGSYSSYVLDLKLGQLCEETDAPGEARKHYLGAMRTVLSGVDLSCGTALGCLLRLSGSRPLSKSEIRLAEKVIRKSWEVLRIPGRPETQDLLKASTILEERQGHRVGQ